MKRSAYIRSILVNDAEYSEKEVDAMSNDEVFIKLMHWEGIFGYEERVKGWISGIYGVTLKN